MSQTEAQKMTEDVKARIDLGDDSYSIANTLEINRDAVREIILQRKSGLCETCVGKGKKDSKTCGTCNGLGAQD